MQAIPTPEVLAQSLKERVLAQDSAIDKVAKRVAYTIRLWDQRPERPNGVFLFVGPTGVGKTSLAVALAEELAPRGDNIIQLDMSEYSGEWSVSKLIGPPPGYSGSQVPDSWLTTRVKRSPRAVLLLDEIEKADHTVQQLFLQVFEEGRLTDSLGYTADFSNTVVVMTSNFGARSTQPIGFVHGEPNFSEVHGSLRAHFSPEFMGRIDDVITFDPLNGPALRAIARNMVDRMIAARKRDSYFLTVDDSALEAVIAFQAQPQDGARYLARNIDSLLGFPLLDCPPGRYSAVVELGSLTWSKN